MNDYHRYICPKCGHVQYSGNGRFVCPLCHSMMKKADSRSGHKRPVILWVIFLIVLLSGLALRSYNANGGKLPFQLPGISKYINQNSTTKQEKSLPSISPSAPSLVPTPDIHQALLNGLSEKKAVITINGRSVEDIKKEVKAITRDHPELFWFSGSFSTQTHTTNLSTWTEVTPKYFDIENAARKEEQLHDVIYGISTLIPENAPAYEKALFVHDFIVNTTEYDYASMNKKEYSDASSAYGCLVEHKAVCGGYAKAYKVLLDYLGIPCGYVTGNIIGRGSHAWNYITLDNVSCYVDVTWDDCAFNNDEIKNFCSHEYFFVTATELKRTHMLDPGQEIPPCDSTDYDYFRLNGLYFEEYTADQIGALIFSANEGIWAEIKFSSPEQQVTACRTLFLDGGLNYYLSRLYQSGYRFMYSSKETSQVLKYLVYRA